MGRTFRIRPGFSLVEVLVSVAVIAVLLSLLLPALIHARRVGQGAVCANSLRQLGIAWASYLHDFEEFPRYSAQPDWRYGGVVFAQTGTTTIAALDPARPINGYIDGAGHADAAAQAALFRCPADSGVWERSGIRQGPRLSILNGKSAYEYFGSSYRANPFLMDAGLARLDTQRRALRTTEIHGVSSRLVLMGDPAWYYSSISADNPDARLDASWHAPDRGNFLALDGSVRTLRFERGGASYDINPGDLINRGK